MFSLVSIESSAIETLGKAEGPSVIATASGDAARGYDAEVYSAHGVVSRPSKKTKGIRIQLGKLSIILAAYTYGVDPPENAGETKIYSTDADGEEEASHLLGNDGTHTFNNGSDNAVRYSDLKTAFDQLKSDFNALVSQYNLHTHAETGTTTLVTTMTGASSSADMSSAKVEEIKIP